MAGARDCLSGAVRHRQRTIPVYEALARRDAASGKKPHVAFVRVPSDPGTPVPSGLFHSQLPLHATLDASRQWFATTPIVVEIVAGRVTAVVSGKKAMGLQGMKAAAHHRETAGGVHAAQ